MGSTIENSPESEIYDLLILVDATFSMEDYLASLQASLPKIISISALTNSFSRIGLLAYRDYCDQDLIEWSGWMEQNDTGATEIKTVKPKVEATKLDTRNGPKKAVITEVETKINLLEFTTGLEPWGGGDYPEATKTGLAKAYEVMREEATTIILLYTDAPPHTLANATENGYKHAAQEQDALSEPDSYGGTGYLFKDWVHASRVLSMKEGNKRAQVLSILSPSMARSDGTYYTLLSTITGGACFYLNEATPKDISQVTVDLLLTWMGAEKAGAEIAKINAKLSRFKSLTGLDAITKEASKASKGIHTEELVLDSKVLKDLMPQRKIPVVDFARRYANDETYKSLVVKHLKKIIEEDVSAISLNPVFGSLWRAVCNDRDNDERDALVTSFSFHIDNIKNVDEKERMKNWLAGSYDYTSEIQEAIASIPEDKQFPCVYVDPTLDFANFQGEDEDNRPITEFRRDELLEIGRSCNYKILQRLGRVLTRLTFVNTPEELPAHIKKAEEGTIIKIPLALASKEYGRKLWRILLHIIVPGTMLSARPAALLAALTIKLGVQPFFEAAVTEMMVWRDKWSNTEIPETWNVSCLSLLLDADRAYLGRMVGKVPENEVKGLLKDTDRQLFDRLASYKTLELNLKTSLTATLSWKPDKTVMPIGPVVECRACHFPRSVTSMASKGICGHCACEEFSSLKERQRCITENVSKDDNSDTTATWVECCTRTCRVQYVVYRPRELNVRPKCHYCRQQTAILEEDRDPDPAPWLECKTCLSKVVYAEEYRTSADRDGFKCVACSYKRQTIVEVETTALELSKENGTSWMLENKGNKLKEPLLGGSLFKQITSAGTDGFCDKVKLFPHSEKTKLVLKGKLIRNTPALLKQLESWVSGRRAERGICSLCFLDFRKTELNLACGRRGCAQKVCRNCLESWYGINRPGKLINIAALSCPFCRRPPAAKTLSAYGMGIHAVGDLRDAVMNAGEWVYAWCMDCARAKQYLERVCATGAPAELKDYVCEGCSRLRIEHAAAEVVRLEAQTALEAREAAELITFRHQLAMQPTTVRKCPGCGTFTEKIDGCGHMTCVCGQHWCFFCGEASTNHEIYGHMDERHGGWFDAVEDMEIVWCDGYGVCGFEGCMAGRDHERRAVPEGTFRGLIGG